MELIVRVAKWIAKDIIETLVSLVLFVSLLWSLYRGTVVSWTIFGLALVEVIVFILKPKKSSESECSNLETKED